MSIDLKNLPPMPDEDTDLDAAEDVEEEAAPAPYGETPPEVDAPEAAPVTDEDEGAEEDAPEADKPDYEALSQKAQQWDAWGERFARDPAAFMSTFFNAMPPEAQAQFLAASGVKAPQDAEPEAEYEPQSDIESLYLKERKQYQADRKALAELPKFAQTVNQEFSIRDQFINDVSIQANILEHKLNAVLELLDANFPDADTAAIQKALLSGKTTYAEAVSKAYKPTLEKAVKIEKQSKKVRPATPANRSNSNVDLSREKDMAKIFRLIGT